MILQEVNTVALAQAINAVVGAEKGAMITQLYSIVDQAMKEGYDLGVVDGQKDREDAMDAAFDEGWDAGQAFLGLDEAVIGNVAYDEGYCDGVADARARPQVADDNVQDIINVAAAEALNGEYTLEQTFDYDLVRDSGDEQVQDEA